MESMSRSHTQELAVTCAETLPDALRASPPCHQLCYQPVFFAAAGLASGTLLAQIIGLVSLGIMGWLIAPLLAAFSGFIAVGLIVEGVANIRYTTALERWYRLTYQELNGSWCRYRVVTQALGDEAVVQLLEYCPVHPDGTQVDNMMFSERVVRQEAFGLDHEIAALELMTEWSGEAKAMEREAKAIAARRDEAVHMAERINQQNRLALQPQSRPELKLPIPHGVPIGQDSNLRP